MKEEKINREVEKLDDRELLSEYVMACDPDCNLDITPLEQSHRISKSKEELLKRLSKNSVEDYKKRLVEEIKTFENINLLSYLNVTFRRGMERGLEKVKKIIDNIK